MEKSIEDFKTGRINLKALKASIELNGRALEMMAYSMIKDLDEIEYQLTVSLFADEEDCYADTEEVLEHIISWLEKVPVEENE